MAEPRLLQVGTEETIETVKGESGLSSAQVGTEAKVVEKSNDDPVGVYVADTNVVSDNSRTLKVSKDRPAGVYEQNIKQAEGFERSKGDKNIVNTITVDEVKALIKQYGGGNSYTKEEIDHIVETMRKGLYQEVDTTEYPTLEDFLESDGEEGIIYLYPVGNEGNNYYQYIWETTKEWISLGTTVVDLSQYYTKTESDAKFVDLDSAQTITGIKTFADFIKFNTAGKGIDCTNYFVFRKDGINVFTYDGIGITPWGANKQLGTSYDKWKDLYLSGKIKDGTNEFNADNVFNVINASDIVNNTLTQAQYDLITNGKPTLIKGAISGITPSWTSYLLFPCGDEYSGSRFGILIATRNGYTHIQQYSISVSTKAFNILYGTKYIDFDTSTNITIKGLYSINDKTLPAYKTDTTKQYKFVQKVGGNLDYVEDNDFSPTSVSLSDGGTISDTTLQANIQYHRPIVLNGFTCYFSCDDGTNYQYTSMRYDANANKNHINVITINKSTWVATFHTSDLTLN